ncbi:hypothetical protein JQ596_12790 [Bradyrhizobium manausense]|uniref:COG3904 family protein n=1 Tax=Bradyrhizobium TaxID=374 RepID=UPI001BA51C40|nr:MULTISPECIES: hypothetical protein [Bradyrhizobium]MBR0826418.1 hypothetical protein [Bradyrhizobium manausense]UVO28824.1 hypothetical protein KUF59_41425 [Bradyrhizobium arachidis]
MSENDRGEDDNSFRSSPTGPRVAPPRAEPVAPPHAPPRVEAKPLLHLPKRGRLFWSLLLFALLASGTLIRAYRDTSRPEAWAYWKDQYFSPHLSATVIPNVNLGGGAGSRRALAVTGEIGPAAASWLRDRIDEAKLGHGDLILLSSPGGNLAQAVIMGEAIRARGLDTAVGVADSAGRVRAAYCASACVLAFAGGKVRYGVEGSALGVHRFVNAAPGSDPVADTQRVAGMVLGYMTRMGVSSSVVEAMSETREVRWLDPKQAVTMRLITDPIGGAH